MCGLQFLPTDINIYVTTAADPDESSWGTYCPPSDMVNGVEIGACLGDEYSVHWMEDADRPDSMDETLEQQFLTVQKETLQSHVTQYGEEDWTDLPVGDFEGNMTQIDRRRNRRVWASRTRGTHAHPKHNPTRALTPSVPARVGMTDSRDAKLQFLYWQYLRAKTSDEAAAAGDRLRAEIEHRKAGMI